MGVCMSAHLGGMTIAFPLLIPQGGSDNGREYNHTANCTPNNNNRRCALESVVLVSCADVVVLHRSRVVNLRRSCMP